jgi:hypothetical protein
LVGLGEGRPVAKEAVGTEIELDQFEVEAAAFSDGLKERFADREDLFADAIAREQCDSKGALRHARKLP